MVKFNIYTPELFNNIAQLQCNGEYYDFHNDYSCSNILLEYECLNLSLKHLINNLNVCLVFSGVTVTKINFSFNEQIIGNLTLDNLYRGRFELKGNLYEYDNMKRCYYYLEFYEGYSLEFFANNLQLQIIA